MDTMEPEPLVSVIVPVYNVEKYLNACLESVTGQTYQNAEIILVDDGSTDSSGKKCDSWAKKDSRIKVIHKKNEGLNYARRDGFRAASGEYITFIDSDDLVHKDYLKTLFKSLQNSKTDVAVSGYQEFREHDDIKPVNDTGMIAEKDTATIMKWFIKNETSWNGRVYMMTAWGKMYHRNLLASIDWGFSNYRANEDEFWTMQVLYGVKNGIVVVPSEMYYYRINQSSITRKKYTNTFNGRNLNKFELIEELYQKSLSYLGSKYRDDLLWRLSLQVVVFIDKYADNRTLSLRDIMSAKKCLYPKLDDISKINLPDPIKQKVNFIKKYGLWTYVFSVRYPQLWNVVRRMRKLLLCDNISR